MSNIRPIPKIQNPKRLNDYRPISILSPLSKPLDRLLCSQITHFLSKNGFFEPLQSGFRPKHSNCTVALKFTTDIKFAMDSNHIMYYSCFL